MYRSLILSLFLSVWAKGGAYHLGNSPVRNHKFLEEDILGFEDKEERVSVNNKNSLWPEGIIYYTMDSSLSSQETDLNRIMKDFEDNTCLKFEKRTTQRDYTEFFRGNGCYSHVGRVRGKQPVSLGSGCHSLGAMTHVLGHTIGFYHEHSRPDRDEYVDIHWENVLDGQKSCFYKFNPSQVIMYNDFDYDSIMLLGETICSKGGTLKTMTANKEGIRIRDVNEKYPPTKSDYYRINKMYNCLNREL